MPENWRYYPIRELAANAPQSFTDGDWIEAPHIRETGIRLIQTGNIGIGSFINRSRKYISQASFDALHCKEVRPGDLLICRLAEPIGRACFAPDLGERMITSVDVTILRVDTESFDPRFVSFCINTPECLRQCETVSGGTTRQRISRTNLGKVALKAPSVGVQRRIADILSTLDAAIEQTEALIAKHQQIKAGLMHDLFTRGVTPDGHLRPTCEQAPSIYKESPLGWIPKEWDVVPLGGLVRELVAGVSVNSTDNPAGAGQVGVLKTSCVGSGLFHPAENKTVVPEDIARACVSPRRDTILISRMNTPLLVGESGYVPEDFPNLFLPDRLWMTILDETSGVCCRWLAQLIQWRVVREKISGLATGTSGSMKNISKSKLIALELATPKPDEQVAISARLGSIDDQLTTEDGMLAKLRQQKNGLMNDLLTGRVRVKFTEKRGTRG